MANLFGGFASGLRDQLSNPMFLGGASMLAGGGWDGAMQGMKMGMGMQEQDAANQRRAVFGKLAQQQSSPQVRELLGAVDPDTGSKLLLTQLMQKPEQTGDQLEYAMARQQGFQGSLMDYQLALKKAGATNVSVANTQEGSYDKNMGEGLAKMHGEAESGAAKANRDLSSLRVAEQALNDPNLYTGTGGGSINAMKNGMQSLFGINVKGVASSEVLSTISSEIALGNRDKMPGPMSNGDREFLVEMGPSLSKSPEGNRLILSLGMASKAWEIGRAKTIREYAARNGGRLNSGVYASLSENDAKAQEEFNDILGDLRELGELAPRAPTVGTPLTMPKGWSYEVGK